MQTRSNEVAVNSRTLTDSFRTSRFSQGRQDSLQSFVDNRPSWPILSLFARDRQPVIQMVKIPALGMYKMMEEVVREMNLPELDKKKREERFHPIHVLGVRFYLLAQLQFLEQTCFKEMEERQYNALMLSTAMNTLAEALILEQTAIQFRPEIAHQLFNYFQRRLRELMAQAETENVETVVHQAEVLSSANPLELYLKDVLPPDEIIPIIMRMAAEGGMTPMVCIDLLYRQLLAHVVSIGEPAVLAQEDLGETAGNWTGSVKDVAGFVSLNFQRYLLDEPCVAIKPPEYVTLGKCADRIELLKGLFTAVVPVRKIAGGVPYENNYPMLFAIVHSVTGYAPMECTQIMNSFRDWILNFPIQIAVHYGDWFGSQGSIRQENLRVVSMLERLQKRTTVAEMMHLKKQGNEIPVTILDSRNEMMLQGRSVRYPSYRWEKDMRGARKPLSVSEGPVYGAIRFWDKNMFGAGGSVGYGAVTVTLKPEFILANLGNIRFKGGVELPERADLLLMLEDHMTREANIVNMLFFSFWNGCNVAFPRLDFEVVIYGGFDLKEDTDWEIVISKEQNFDHNETLDKKQLEQVKRWAKSVDKSVFMEPSFLLDDRHTPTLSRTGVMFIPRTLVYLRSVFGDPCWINKTIVNEDGISLSFFLERFVQELRGPLNWKTLQRCCKLAKLAIKVLANIPEVSSFVAFCECLSRVNPEELTVYNQEGILSGLCKAMDPIYAKVCMQSNALLPPEKEKTEEE